MFIDSSVYRELNKLKSNKFISLVLTAVIAVSVLLPCVTLSHSADSAGIVTHKSAVRSSDDSDVYDISIDAYQSGKVVPTDIVMVLDVSGSMAWGIPVELTDIVATKTYYVEYTRLETVGQVTTKTIEHIPAYYSGSSWYIDVDSEAKAIVPGDLTNQDSNIFVFYTGFLDDLKAAASGFAQSIAANSAEYGIDHRIAVVEFSSAVKNSDTYSICTHTNSYYANILTGSDFSPENAFVSASAGSTELSEIFGSLTAKGPTYSDDALSQAVRIFEANPSQGRNKVVILFTDGGPGSYGWTGDTDNSAIPTANRAIAAAYTLKSTYSASVYTIGMFDEANLSNETGIKNEEYLGCISSNYPLAQSLSIKGNKAADRYCTVGSSALPLNNIFDDISKIIGETVNGATVSDYISQSFYLSDSQKDALTAAYPGVTITEYRNGTTGIKLENIDLKPIAVTDNGLPVNPNDSGIFTLNFSVTVKKGFWGGNSVVTNTSDSGIYAQSGDLISAFDVPSVDIIPSAKPDFKIDTHDISVTIGDYVPLSSLFTAAPGSWQSQYAGIRYYAEYPDGTAFTGGEITSTTVFTVKADVTVCGEKYTYQSPVCVTALPKSVTDIVLGKSSLELFIGDTYQLSASVLPADATDKSIVWSSSSISVATVADGFITAVGMGSAEITAVSKDGKVHSTCRVTVGAVAPVRIEIASKPSKASYAYKDKLDINGLTVRVFYNNGTDEIVSSGFTAVPEKLSLIRRGTQQITVTYKGLQTSFNVAVKLLWWQWIIVILLFGWIWY